MNWMFLSQHKSALIFALLIAFSSSGFVQKHAGWTGLLVHFLILAGVFLLLERKKAWWEGFANRRWNLCACVILVGLAVIHLSLHSFEDGRGPGLSSDRDEGLEIAVSRLLSGQSPYYPAHPEAGPLSVLPGAILLAAPFVMMGWVGLQNIFWLGMFLLILARQRVEMARPLAWLSAAMILSPSFQYEIISGGDMVANGAYVASVFLLATACFTHPASSAGRRLLMAVMLGLVLASRANFLLLLPLWAALLWSVTGPKTALWASGVSALSYLGWVLPFYAMNPNGFTPLKSREKIMFNGETLMWADEAVLGLTILALCILSLRLMRSPAARSAGLFQSYACVVTVTPMICMVGLASLLSGSVDCRFMHDRFGLMYWFFALAGLAVSRDAKPSSGSPSAAAHQIPILRVSSAALP